MRTASANVKLTRRETKLFLCIDFISDDERVPEEFRQDRESRRSLLL